MKNKKFKMKIAALAISLLALNTPAHAEQITFDPSALIQSIISYAKEAYSAAQNALTAANTAIVSENSILTSGYTYLTSRAAAGTGQKVAQNTEAVNLATQQSVKNTELRDMQTRKAIGNAKQADIGIGMLPTLAMCAEASKSEAKGASAGASVKGGGGGKNGAPARSMVKTTAEAQAKTLETKEILGTCSPETAGIKGCPSGGGVYAGADMHPRGIKGDVKNIGASDESKPAYNNNTLDDSPNGAWDIAKKYSSDMAFYDKPKVASEEQMKKNPVYASLYQSMQTKLNAAQDAVLDVAKIRRASSTDITASVAGQEWSKISASDYKKVTGLLTKPTNKPSLFDMLNYQVRNDYLGNKDAKLDSTEEVNKRMAALTFIAWQQYQQQENTNILLSHILVQLTTPITKAQVDNEHSKTMNLK